jgi:hypothetical protein
MDTADTLLPSDLSEHSLEEFQDSLRIDNAVQTLIELHEENSFSMFKDNAFAFLRDNAQDFSCHAWNTMALFDKHPHLFDLRERVLAKLREGAEFSDLCRIMTEMHEDAQTMEFSCD